MVDYTVKVLGQKGKENVYIKLIGTVGESKPQDLFWHDKETIACERSLGTLLMVELEARPWKYLFNEWFCDKIVVTTPEGDEIHFPCYQWLDSKNSVVCLREQKATLVYQDMDIELCSQRHMELKRRCQDFMLTELKLETPFRSGSWHSLDDLHDHLHGFNGNIFLCDYQRLDGLTGNVINDTQQYLSAPLCLLFSTPDKTLKPIAIQLQQKPENNPIFLPTDSELDWLLAKIFVRNAEFNEHELNFHLLRTHLLSEVFTVATLRNLPSAHPLYKLLRPHTRYTLHINIMAREKLISSTGHFAKYTAIGRDEVVHTFLKRAFSSLTYSSLCPPDDIKARGLEDIPNFYYRDDGLQLWNIISGFVANLLTHYYQTDDDVKKDTELQNWIKEIFKYGFQENIQTGIPQSFTKLNDLIKFVTMVIFTASAQHAAVNNGQFDFGGWMPNFPSSLRLPPPKKKGSTTEETIPATLPDVNTTVYTMAFLYLLSKKSTDRRQLGDYREQLFESDVKGVFDHFQKDLQKLDEKIQHRNKGFEFPYWYLQPTHVDNSVDL